MPHNRPPHDGTINRIGVDRVNSEGGADGPRVLDFHNIDHTQVAVVGGKGAQLAELSGSKASACRLAFA